MKKVILFLAVFTFAAFTYLNAQPYQTNAPALTLHEASSVCVPDGIANTDGTEPWTSTWIPLAVEKTTNTVHEMTAQFQIAYGEEFLWVIAQQKGNSQMDTGAVAIPNSWERDDFEVFVSIDTTSYSRKGVYKNVNSQFRLERATVYPWGFDDCHSIGKNNPTFKIGQVDAGDGSFIQEWQMPWRGFMDAVKDTSGKLDGFYIKFEIQAADNTTGRAGGRTDQRFWINNSDNEYQDTRTLSVIYLAEFIFGDKINQTNYQICDLSVFPNPASDNVNITFNLKQSGNVSIDVYNILGEHVANIFAANQSAGVLKNTIDLNEYNMNSGIYYIKISANNSSIIKKLSILK
jgi:hypothetical protein